MYLFGILTAAAAAWLLRQFSYQQYIRLVGAIGILLLISEIWKQWYMTAEVYVGYPVVFFPFQLCSLPLYLCPALFFLKRRGQQAVIVFLMTFTLMGACAVFLDTTGLHYPRTSLTVHSYLWHYVLVFLGILSGLQYRKLCPPRREHLRAFLPALLIFAVCLCIATALNIALRPFGDLSMFYISPYEENLQIVFHDIAVRFGIAAGNIAYIAAMVIGALLFHLLWGIGLDVSREHRGL